MVELGAIYRLGDKWLGVSGCLSVRILETLPWNSLISRILIYSMFTILDFFVINMTFVSHEYSAMNFSLNNEFLFIYPTD